MRGIGALLIVLASAALGLGFVRSRGRRLYALREICAGLELLSAELDKWTEPLPRTLERLGTVAPECAGTFFCLLAEKMTELGERRFAELWSECVEASFPDLKKQERQELCSLGGILGRYELSRQLEGIDRCRTRLALDRDRAAASFGQEQRLGLGLSLTSGVLLALVLF